MCIFKDYQRLREKEKRLTHDPVSWILGWSFASGLLIAIGAIGYCVYSNQTLSTLLIVGGGLIAAISVCVVYNRYLKYRRVPCPCCGGELNRETADWTAEDCDLNDPAFDVIDGHVYERDLGSDSDDHWHRWTKLVYVCHECKCYLQFAENWSLPCTEGEERMLNELSSSVPKTKNGSSQTNEQ